MYKKSLPYILILGNRSIESGSIWTGGKFISGRWLDKEFRRLAHVNYFRKNFTEVINIYEFVKNAWNNKN